MDKLLAEYCDIVMNHANSFTFHVSYNNTSVKEKITISNWSKAIDVIHQYGYLDPLSNDKYKVRINDFGKKFLLGGGSFVKIAIEKEFENEQSIKRQKNQDDKLEIDLRLSRFQKKTYWIVFVIAVSSFITTIILAIDKFTTKPIIEKVYIPVDSQGETISPLPKTFNKN